MWTVNFQMFKLDIEKAEEPKIKLPTSIGSLKKQESFRKASTSALLSTPKPLTVWITAKCGKFFKRWEYQTTWPASWEICMQVKKQQLELDMEQQTGSKSGEENIKAVYCHCDYLTYMQSTSWEMLGWRKHKLESRSWGEIPMTSDMQMIQPLWQKGERNYRASWLKWKEESEKVGLKLNIHKTKIWSHHFMANRWGNNGSSERIYLLGLQNDWRWWLQPWN